MALIKKYFPSFFLPLVLIYLNISPSLSYVSFIFGDSLVDAGNNDYLFTVSKANLPPYGIDFRPSGGQPTGRFTNGRTISDLIGQGLGQKSFSPPYLAPNSSENILRSGINYASGSSGILDETGAYFIGRLPLRRQIEYFEATRVQMVNMMGENATMEFLKNAIFSLSIGSNDILNYIQPSIPFFNTEKPPPSVLQDMMISNLTLYLKKLHGLGARKVFVVDVGPLGCIPFVRAMDLTPEGKCSLNTNKLVQGYNTKLRQMIYQLNHDDLGPESIFVYANSYDIVMQVLKNPVRYGFVNYDEPCCGASFPPFLCVNSSSVFCDDRTKYVFWDAYHPTETMNNIIAYKFLNDDSRAIIPMNIRKLYEYEFK
ncbi:hypothetical protein LUZ60_016361 [Juncus effusus]|nr:hypothetical protein LUZ60_016361 [Juncus effusus]